MSDKKIEFDNQVENIREGIGKAVQKMLHKSAANNEDVVIGDDNGGYKIVPAKDLLKEQTS